MAVPGDPLVAAYQQHVALDSRPTVFPQEHAGDVGFLRPRLDLVGHPADDPVGGRTQEAQPGDLGIRQRIMQVLNGSGLVLRSLHRDVGQDPETSNQLGGPLLP